MTPSMRHPADDRPIIIKDRRRKGFFTIDNELLDRYGSQLKAHGLAVYMALARFANQDGTCWPSLSTLGRITGISRPQVIREIAKLKVLNLIAVEHQVNDKGEYSSNTYILLDITPSAPHEGIASARDQGSLSQRLPLVSAGDQGSLSQRPKQNLKNKTQHQNNTQRTTRARADHNNNNSSDSPEQTAVVVAYPSSSTFSCIEAEPCSCQEKAEPSQPTASVTESPIPLDPPSPMTPTQASEQALLAIGIGRTVARRLAARYRAERILEKIEFLAFLQAARPDIIENPRGWLRKAIEEDYGPPDGFMTAAERAHRDAETAEQARRAEALAQQQHASAAQRQTQQEAFRRQLDERYGTTEADEQFWHEVCADIRHSHPHLYQLCTRAYMLTCSEDTVLLGFDAETWLHQLEHPGTRAALKRALKGVAGRPLEVTTVLLPMEAIGYTGGDGTRVAAQE